MTTKKKLFVRGVFCLGLAWFAFTTMAQDKAASSVTLEGQVVCSLCWFEADRRVTPYGNDGDLKCAVDCARKGKAQAIAVATESEFTLYLLEPGTLKRHRKDWLDYIGRTVKATGTIREDGTKRYLRINSIQVVSPEQKREKS